MVYKCVHISVYADAYKDQRSRVSVFYHFLAIFFCARRFHLTEIINSVTLTTPGGTDISLPLPLSIKIKGGFYVCTRAHT